jgi:hypothetical protein
MTSIVISLVVHKVGAKHELLLLLISIVKYPLCFVLEECTKFLVEKVQNYLCCLESKKASFGQVLEGAWPFHQLGIS